MQLLGGEERSISPVIGVILMVAITVLLAVVAGVFFTGFDDKLNGNTANAKVSFEESPVGLEMVVEVITIEADVRLNGKTIGTIDEGDAGTSMLIPTAPGDRITIVSGDSTQSVLVDEEIDERSEMGDLITYYTFEEGSGSTVVDKSGNGNDGTAKGGYTRVSQCGGAMDFDGSSGYVDVGDLTLVGPDSINEITVAIKYQHDGGSGIQNLIEHEDGTFAWYFETDTKYDDPHRMEYNIGWASPPARNILTGDISAGSTQVLIGTYDRSTEKMSLYRNGNHVNTIRNFNRDVGLGKLILAADSHPSYHGQHLDGRLCEVRLYYHAFDNSEVTQLQNAME